VLLVVAVVAVAGAPDAGAKIRRESWVWDPGVEAIAHRVEALRGLRFRYPVRIVLRRAGVIAAPNGAQSDAASLARGLRHLQALGVVPATATVTDLTSGATRHPLGQYHPETESITVWRARMDALARVVIAHELTHALDDQHYHFARRYQSPASPSVVNARRAAVDPESPAWLLLCFLRASSASPSGPSLRDRAGFPAGGEEDRVLERIDQGEQRRLDDVARAADRRPPPGPSP